MVKKFNTTPENTNEFLPGRQKSFGWLPRNRRTTPIQKYVLAVLFVAAATELKWLLEHVGLRQAFILHYPAVILAALIGGLGPGVLATALTVFAVDYFFIEPRGSFSIARFPDALGLAIFCFNAVFITVIAHLLRKATEKARQETEERLRLAQQAAEIGTFGWDIQQNVVRWGPKLEAIHGLSPGSFAGTREAWEQSIHPEDWPEVLRRVARSLKTFEPEQGEWRVVWPDGSVHWVIGRWQVFKDRFGQPSHMTGVNIDVTEKKRAEEVLRASEANFAKAEMIAHLANWDVDVRTSLVRGSAELYRLFNLEPDVPLAAYIEKFHPHDRAYVVESINAAVYEGKPYRIDYRIIPRPGAIRYVHAEGEVTHDANGVPLKFFGTVQDITERKGMEDELRRSRDELELRVRERTAELQEAYNRLVQETREREKLEEHLRQAQKMEAMGTLAGGVAHDFNNMLAVIIGNAELAIDDVHGRARENLKQIVSASKRATDLVRQILAFSRKTELEKSLLSLTPLIKETFKLLRSSLPSTIEMKLDIQTASDTIIGDPSQIQQVLMNLATNANYAMRDKGGNLLISLSDVTFPTRERVPDADMQAGRYVKLTVEDTGTGITEDVKRRMFEPFFTTKGVGQGTGMGLAVVYGIVKSHGGAITVESKVGQGSTFDIFLPCSDEIAVEKKESTAAVLGGNEKILLIDDEPAVAQMTSDTLRSLGYEVTSEISAARALSTFLSEPHRFDLIITDQVMPGLTGTDLAQKMLEVRKDLPIILTTGYSETVSSESARSIGITEFVLKPIAKREVAGTVRRVLDDRKHR